MAETQALTAFVLPKRPGFGTTGQQVKIRANCYAIKKLPDCTVYHYDLQVHTDRPLKREQMNAYWKRLLASPETGLGDNSAVFDGMRNIYTPRPLPFGDRYQTELQFGGDRPAPAGRERPPIRISLTRVATINLAEVDQVLHGRNAMTPDVIRAISGLEMVLKYRASTEYISFPPYRSFYSTEGRKALPGALEVYSGWTQHLRPAIDRMYININMVATAFLKAGNLVDLAADALGKGRPETIAGGLQRGDVLRLTKMFKGATFHPTHIPPREGRPPPQKKIYKFTDQTARDIKFKTQDGKTYDVATYFKAQYNIILKYPNLPCVEVPGKNAAVFPMEVCFIEEGNKYQRKLADLQLAEMIKFTAVKPDERFQRIMRGFQKLDYNNDPHCKDWGLQVDTRPAEVNARILQPPQLGFAGGLSVRPQDGTWEIRQDKKYFHQPTAIHSWAFMSFGRATEGQIKPFVRMLIETMIENGANIPNKNPPIKKFNPRLDIEEALREAANAAVQSGNALARQVGRPEQNEPQLIVVLFDGKTDLYKQVKQVAETKLGVLTSCADTKRCLQRLNKQYCGMWALKTVSKLKGVVWQPTSQTLDKFGAKGTMVLGADVTHGETFSLRPSVAAVVSSLDKGYTKYAAHSLTQGAREEKITQMGNMVGKCISAYQQANGGNRPGAIVLFRDGISEGQYEEIVTHELNAMKAACRKLDASYNPPITYVVVLKRHHVRFQAVDRQGQDRSSNVKSGTCVDTQIAHPLRPDFFLVSQAGLQGTSRPTYYTVLHDENKMSADDLQNFAYHLTFSFCRCPRAVGLTTPVYYAHLAAERTRIWQDAFGGEDTESSISGSAPGSTEVEAANRIQIHPRLANVLYFV